MPISLDRDVHSYSPGDIIPKTEKRLLENVDLNFNGDSTQHATHSLHPYVAAINPPLARKLIDTYVPAKGKVLDPFCGGGGVLIESLLSGRDCAGFDINPLAIMIAKAKTTWIDFLRIKGEYLRIQCRAKEVFGEAKPLVSDAALFWYKPENAIELAALSLAVSECQEEDLKNLFSVIFSYTARSVMLTYRGEVRLRKLTGKDYDKFSPNSFSIFENKYLEVLRDVPELPKKNIARVELANILKLPLENNSYHSVICSPPYADDTNGVGYFQFSKYMLEWLGMAPDTIMDHKRQFLGGEKNGKTLPPSATLYISGANLLEKKPELYKDLVAFYSDYVQGLSEMKRTITNWIIIIIGNRVLGRTVFDNANITIELFGAIGGVHLHDYYQRVITKKRMPNLGSDGGGINVEHILIFKKS